MVRKHWRVSGRSKKSLQNTACLGLPFIVFVERRCYNLRVIVKKDAFVEGMEIKKLNSSFNLDARTIGWLLALKRDWKLISISKTFLTGVSI